MSHMAHHAVTRALDARPWLGPRGGRGAERAERADGHTDDCRSRHDSSRRFRSAVGLTDDVNKMSVRE